MMLKMFHFFFSSDEPRIRNPYRWLPRKDEKDKKDKKKSSDKSASSESQVKCYIINGGEVIKGVSQTN